MSAPSTNELWLATNTEGQEVWAICSSPESLSYTVVVDDSVSWSKHGLGLHNIRKVQVVPWSAIVIEGIEKDMLLDAVQQAALLFEATRVTWRQQERLEIFNKIISQFASALETENPLVMGEISPAENFDLFSRETEQKYPHGIYACGCGKIFHGHGNRDMHSSNCAFTLSRGHII